MRFHGRVRVVLAPDCFGGTLTAPQAADAIATGWSAVRPQDELVVVPLSDGGPGFVDVLPGTLVSSLVSDPLGRPTLAQWRLDGTTAWVESAQACGLHLLEQPDASGSTAGVGQLVAAAVGAGATRAVVGLGGSGTNDGGRGFVETCPAGVELVAATDVDNPLLGPEGATRVFGPQKGATDLDAHEARMTAWADELETRLGVRVRDLPGAGAAGGLGFALLALGARRVSGVSLVADAVGLDVAGADLVLTGEGSFDWQSLRGKVVAGVAARALEEAVPCLVLAGRTSVGRREAAAAGVEASYSLVELVGEERALSEPVESLTALASRVAGQWRV